MDFSKYRLPASVREGVEIELPGAAGAKFRVRLPSRYNREYTAAQQRGTQMAIGADGKPDFSKVDFVSWQQARLQAFLEHCILDYPEGMTRDLLDGDYRPALEALFDIASDMADAEDEEAIETTKKLKA